MKWYHTAFVVLFLTDFTGCDHLGDDECDQHVTPTRVAADGGVSLFSVMEQESLCVWITSSLFIPLVMDV